MLSQDGIERFPRLREGEILRFPRLRKHYHSENGTGSKMRRLRSKIASGILPRGWDHLSKDQKKLAKRIASGMAVRDACHLSGVKDPNTFYIWRELHPLFKAYYYKVAHRFASTISDRLDSKLPRAVRVVEESLDNGDPYFRHEAAVGLLKGRGIYKPTTNVQGEVLQKHAFTGTVDVKHNHKMDREFAMMFVGALQAKAQGAGLKRVEPKVIDAEVIKELPPAMGMDASPQIQDSRQKETVEKD